MKLLDMVLKRLKNPHIYVEDKLKGNFKEIVKNTQDVDKDFINDRIISVSKNEDYDESIVCNTSEEDLALIQFSSGSTGMPKGVAITHENLLENCKGVLISGKDTEFERILCWLPLIHNFSLIGVHITGIVGNWEEYLMDVQLFLLSPIEWLNYMSKYKINLSASPNFGLLRSIEQMKKDVSYDWDFSNLRIIISGAEPINDACCEAFINTLRKYGMKDSVVTPAYGMSENTVAISIGNPDVKYKKYFLDRDNLSIGDSVVFTSEDDKNCSVYVESGPIVTGSEIRITDDNGEILDADIVGNIELRGKGIMKCYYNDPENTKKAFTHDGWLKTGDIGVIIDGNVVVIGRKKEVMLLNGKIRRFKLVEMYKEGNVVKAESHLHSNERKEENMTVEQKWMLVKLQDILENKNISIDDDFMLLGLNSIKCGRYIALINEKFNINANIGKIFEYPTIRKLSEFIISEKKNSRNIVQVTSESTKFKASAQQQRMYALNRMDPDSINYNIFVGLNLKGNFNIDKAEKVFKQIIDRHESLRTIFTFEDGTVYQNIQKEIDFKIDYMDKCSETDECIRKFIRPFDLQNGPLMRALIIKEKEDSYIMVIDMHHIISDGTTIGNIIDEFCKLYEGQELPKLKYQYKDYSNWQSQLIDSEQYLKEEEYWADYLKGELPSLNLPLDYERDNLQSFEGSRIIVPLDEELKAKINEISKKYGVTNYMVLLSAYSILLNKYTSQKKIILGSAIVGRSQAEFMKTMGLFVNTVVFRNIIEDSKKFSQVLCEVRNDTINAYANQDYQFDWLIKKLNIPKSKNRNPIFDVMFNMRNMELPEFNIDGVEVTSYPIEDNSTRFDLSLIVNIIKDDVNFEFIYCNKLFKEETIVKFKDRFMHILNLIVENPEIRIKDIEFFNQSAFWKNKLGDEIKETNIFEIDNNENKTDIFNYSLGKDISESLNKLTNGNPMALLVTIMAAYKIYISKLINCKDVTILSPIIGDKEKCRYNDIVMIYDNIDSKDTFKDVLMKIKKTVVDAYRNQDYPLEKILEEYDYSKGISKVSDFVIQMDGIHKCEINHNINIVMKIKVGKEISLEYIYNSSIAEKELENFADRFANVLGCCLRNFDEEISRIQIVKEEEKESILKVINSTPKDKIEFNSVKDWFEDTAEKFKDKSAVRTTNKSMTYSELNKKANQLAHRLESEGIKKGDIVGICLEPSIEVIISMLAVIKTGAAYLPVDIGTPNERFKYIISDSNMKMLLLSEKIDKNDLNIENVLYLDNIDKLNMNEFSSENLNVEVSQEDDLYIIYTSGTTGKPKGVRILNKGLLNYVEWFKKYSDLRTDDKAVLVSSYAFDLGYTSLYSSILNGCELSILTKNEYTNPHLLLSYIVQNKITYMKSTPSFFRIIKSSDEFKEGCFASVRLVLLGGENIDLDDIKDAHEAYPELVIANHYGPTETTIGVVSTKIDFNKFDDYCKCPVIGKSISNTNAYVLNDDLNLMPLGCRGELYISGECVSGGYLNNEKLTKERFIDNPYMPGQLLYKTSDCAKMLEDGSIQFFGRSDKQVKIHGYRVEIGEIEYALKLYPDVTQAIAQVRTDEKGINYICGYVVTKKELDIRDLRKFLGKHIADYMIPTYFVRLDNIPLTANGKIDYKSLPEPEITQCVEEYEAPRNEIEEIMSSVWKDVLKCDRVGITDDFFVLGGDSIKAIQVAAKLQKAGLNVELKDIIEYATIKELASNIQLSEDAESEAAVTIEEKKKISSELLSEIKDYYYKKDKSLEIDEVFGVSPSQRQMYLGTTRADKTMCYQNRTCRINAELDLNLINKAYQLLFDKYQVLRTVFYEDSNGEIYEVAFKHRDAHVEFEDISRMSEEEQKAYLEKEVKKDSLTPFDLKHGLLMRTIIYKTGEQKYFVLWSNHHSILDGWGRMIVIKELISNIKDLINGRDIKFSPVNFSRYIENLEKKNYKEAVDFWKKYLEGYKNVPTIKRRQDADLKKGYVEEHISFVLTKEETQKLKDIAVSYKVTLNTLILSMWGKLLQKISNNDDVVFGSIASDKVVDESDIDTSV